MSKYPISQGEMNLVLAAVESGFRACERGENLERAILTILELYEVAKPKAAS